MEEFNRLSNVYNISPNRYRISYASSRFINISCNVGLPASAAVERLSSVGGFIFDDYTSRLSDDHFELLVWLYVNRRVFYTWKCIDFFIPDCNIDFSYRCYQLSISDKSNLCKNSYSIYFHNSL